MAAPLRYTGENPPPSVLMRYPNWVHALDEESVDGQDETTLKPEEVQSHITEETAFTAGDVTFDDGETLPVFIYIVDERPSGFSIYYEDLFPYFTHNKQWDMWKLIPIHGDTMATETASAWWRSRSFPATITSRLPMGRAGVAWRISIDANGRSCE